MADDLEKELEGQTITDQKTNEKLTDISSNIATDVDLKQPVSEGPTIALGDVLADESNTTEDVTVTEDILQQALSEASEGTLDRIEQSNLDSQTSELFAKAVDETPVTKDSLNQQSQFQDQSNDKVLQPPATPSTSAAIISTTTSSASSNLTPAQPLGSKTNPIRIIQQGDTYTSTQELSQDQIQQIVRVLQQQNVQRVVGGSKAVFNAETNTRIVYRVVPPKSAAESDSQSASGVMTARQYHEQKYGKVPSR